MNPQPDPSQAASERPLRFAIVGLGRMGGNLARHALDLGFGVAGYSRRGPDDELVRRGVVAIGQLADLRTALPAPRRVLLYVPAGVAVDALLDELCGVLEPGDVVADGGNAYWGDSIRRQRRMQGCGIGFVDVGTSGGVSGAREGACFMVGGDASEVAKFAPVLTALAVEGGFLHVGAAGSGHFAKLVHNGIEFGMLQAIGEGIDLLAHYPEPLPVADILRNWRHGSVIRGWLVDLMEQALRDAPGLRSIDPQVEDTGEVNWLLDDALRMEVPVPVIAQAVMQLLASRDRDRIASRAVSMLRHGFGGHAYGRDAQVAQERQDGRVGGYIDPRD